MLPYIAEFVGTMLLILLGDGVVANVNLKKSGMNGAGPIQITIALVASSAAAVLWGYLMGPISDKLGRKYGTVIINGFVLTILAKSEL